MKKILPLIFFLVANVSIAQTVSMRIVQTAFSAADPDGAGPAKGSVTIQFELMASGGQPLPPPYSGSGVLGDGMGLSFVYQSALLMATPTNTTVAEGPMVTSVAWTQNVDNRVGNDITPDPAVYGGKSFDKRMIITYQQNQGIHNAPFLNDVWTPVAQLTYWTLGTGYPEGGYATPEPGSYVPQNTLSSEGGMVSYDFLTPYHDTPLPLGDGALPVLFTRFDAHCTNNGSIISWSTASESNSDHFELQHSADGINWRVINKLPAAGNSSEAHNYQLQDFNAGKGFYRINQVDKDGRSTYTSIITTNCEASAIEMIIYPVPARDILNVIIKSDKSEQTQLLLYDASGRIVRRTIVSLASGRNTLLVNLQGLPGGSYMIRTNNPSINVSKPFTIAR